MRLWISAILAAAACLAVEPALAAGGGSVTGEVASVAGRGPAEDMPIKDLRLPLERYEDGKIKTQLVAAQARIPPKGDIEARKVRLEFYKNDTIDALMVADDCRYNRASGTARSDSPIRLQSEGILITGIAFECSVSNQTMTILHDVTVILDHPRKDMGKKEDKK